MSIIALPGVLEIVNMAVGTVPTYVGTVPNHVKECIAVNRSGHLIVVGWYTRRMDTTDDEWIAINKRLSHICNALRDSGYTVEEVKYSHNVAGHLIVRKF